MGIGIGIGLKFGGAPVGNSAEALAWKTNIEANGGTISQALLDIFDNNFFIPAKANGNILNQLDRLNFYAGLSGYEIAARTNMINSSFFVTPVSSPTFNNNGYVSSGTSYLNLNLTPGTNTTKFTANDNCVGVFLNITGYTIDSSLIGSASGPNICYIRRQLTPNIIFADNSNVLVTRTENPTGKAFVSMKKTSIIAGATRINGTQTAATWTNFPSTLTHFELCRNQAGSASGGFNTDSPHLASYHGSSSCDEAALRTILINLATALGV